MSDNDLAKAIWEASRADEGTISATGANHVAAALAPLLAAREQTLIEERDRNKRAAETLGRIVERQCRDVLEATGAHDAIGEDGDGDWGYVWERMAELCKKGRAAEAEDDGGWYCAHEWLDRPESDTRECLICGVER